jgi:hypothetical protein
MQNGASTTCTSESGAPGKPQRGDVDIALNLKMVYNASTFSYSINGAYFTPPSAPVLLQILSGARSPTSCCLLEAYILYLVTK